MTVFCDNPYWNFEKAIIHDGKERKKASGTNCRGKWEYNPLDGAVHLRTVETFPNTQEKDIHGQGKPVKWIAAIMQGCQSKKILDLFCGSGAFIIASEQIDATCYGMEIEPKYIDMIIERWEQFTGDKATKIVE